MISCGREEGNEDKTSTPILCNGWGNEQVRVGERWLVRVSQVGPLRHPWARGIEVLSR